MVLLFVVGNSNSTQSIGAGAPSCPISFAQAPVVRLSAVLADKARAKWLAHGDNKHTTNKR